MKITNNGGPAFPVSPPPSVGGGGVLRPSSGMTLRTYIATEALKGMLAHPTRYKPRTEDQHLHWHDAISKEAYDLADAMLRAERGETPA